MCIARLCLLDGRPDPHADNYLDWIHGKTAAPAGPSKLPRHTGTTHGVVQLCPLDGRPVRRLCAVARTHATAPSESAACGAFPDADAARDRAGRPRDGPDCGKPSHCALTTLCFDSDAAHRSMCNCPPPSRLLVQVAAAVQIVATQCRRRIRAVPTRIPCGAAPCRRTAARCGRHAASRRGRWRPSRGSDFPACE